MKNKIEREDVDRSREDAIVRQLALPPLPPVQFKAEQYMNGVRLTCEGRDRLIDRDGAVSYRVRWAAQADLTTQQGKDYAHARSVIIESLDVPAKVKDTVEKLITDPKYTSGYFFAEGVDVRGNPSVDYAIAGPISNQILDSTVPSDPTHFQTSGSGEYIGSDVVEAVSVSLRQPSPIGSYDGVQLWLKDYINLGTMQEGEFHRGNGIAGATHQFKVNYQVAKRIGTGSITLTNGLATVVGAGTQFTVQAQIGDKIECGTYRLTILSITDDTHLTCTGTWAQNTVTSSDWCVYAKVTIYAVAISKGGTHRPDVTNSPSGAFVFDGSLGTPNGPASVLATVLGNAIRLEFAPVLGTKIKGYRLYRGTGVGVAFALCAQIDEIPQPKDAALNASPNLQFEDSSFTPYDKEQGQVFTYYVCTLNERNDLSTPTHAFTSAISDPSCRLDSPDDTENGGRVGLKNLFYNAMFSGTAAGNVDDNDTNQDIAMFTFVDGGYTPGVAGKGYSGGLGPQADGTNRYKGYTRWAGTKTAGAAALPTFQNNNEIKLPAPGAGKSCFVVQELGAWDDGRIRFMKMRKNGFVTFQIKIRHNGTIPNGGLRLVVEQYNNGVLTGNAKRQYRDTSSNIVYATGIASDFDVPGPLIFSTYQTFWAIYQFDASLGTTKQIRFTFEHHDTSNAGDIFICDPMVNEGTDRGAFTADMADPYVSNPVPINPPPPPPSDGRRPWNRI